jgi:hypothetical protein
MPCRSVRRLRRAEKAGSGPASGASLWLETGQSEAFTPALRLYEGAGFVRCGPFDGYVGNAFSIFMTRAI